MSYGSYKRGRAKQNKIERIFSEWYGRDFASKEILSYLPETAEFSAVADKLLGKFVSREDLRFMKLKDNWDNIVGEQLSDVIQPIRIYNKIIYAEVHPIWLRHLSQDIKDKILININKFCGSKFCERIHFIPRGGTFKSS
jgi:hypothetical protein